MRTPFTGLAMRHRQRTRGRCIRFENCTPTNLKTEHTGLSCASTRTPADQAVSHRWDGCCKTESFWNEGDLRCRTRRAAGVNKAATLTMEVSPKVNDMDEEEAKRTREDRDKMERTVKESTTSRFAQEMIARRGMFDRAEIPTKARRERWACCLTCHGKIQQYVVQKQSQCVAETVRINLLESLQRDSQKAE